MIDLTTYTGGWQRALNRSAPDVGTEVRWPESHDAREADDFRATLRRAGRRLEWGGDSARPDVWVVAQGDEE